MNATAKKCFSYILTLFALLAIFIVFFAIGYLVFGWMGKNQIMEWPEILFVLIGVSIGMLLIERFKTKRPGKADKILRVFTRIAVLTTILFAGNAFFEWFFSKYDDRPFSFKWEMWLACSVAIGIMEEIYEWGKKKIKRAKCKKCR